MILHVTIVTDKPEQLSSGLEIHGWEHTRAKCSKTGTEILNIELKNGNIFQLNDLADDLETILNGQQ